MAHEINLEVVWQGKLNNYEYRVITRKMDLKLGRRAGQVIVERRDTPDAMGGDRWNPVEDSGTHEFWRPLLAEIIASKIE